jgi:replicative DNA helicase
MQFQEDVFIRALLERPADAKTFAQSFEPEWLKTVEYVPILAKIFEFTDAHDTPPSIDTLREVMREEDSKGYEARHKAVLDHLAMVPYEITMAMHTVTKAKSVAVAWSLDSLVNSTAVQSMIDDADGAELMHQIQNWIIKFGGSSEDVERRMEDAFEELIKSRNWLADDRHIACGIDCIDQWTGGGLSARQLGIIMAPTGGGKSMCLMTMAYMMALIEEKRVLFISNELAMTEVAERFGTLISGEKLQNVARDPEIIRDSIQRVKTYQLNNRLYLVEVNRDISTNDIEGMVARYQNLYGWKPDVIVIDYMERMKPTTKGFKQGDTWTYYGAIASDLVRLSKRLNVLVWTAGQTNRTGYASSDKTGKTINPNQSLSQAQGSMRHLQEATAVVAMRQRPDLPLDDDEKRVLEFTPLKMRHSKLPGESMLVEANLSIMKITDKYHKPSDWTKVDTGSGFKMTLKGTTDDDDAGVS